MKALNHVLIYSKNWYRKDDVVEDLKKCLELDGYVCENKEDVFNILLEYFENIEGVDYNKISRFLSGILYEMTLNPQVDRTLLYINYILSCFRNTEIKLLIGFEFKPNYKIMKRRKFVYFDKSIKYKFKRLNNKAR